MKKLMIFCLWFSFSMLAKEVWEGNHYQTTCRPQYEIAEYVINHFLPKRHFQSILDIGCGSGNFTKELTNFADYVLGVDYSPSMIKKAQELYVQQNLDFMQGDIRNLVDIHQTFDLITAFHPIQWIPSSDQRKAFEQMANLLNPNGICLVLVSDRFNIFYDPLMKTIQQPKWQCYMPKNLEPWNWQTVGSISKSFEQVNLRPLNVFIWYKKYHSETKQEFIDFMANWFYGTAHFNYIHEEQQTELFQEVLNTFLTSISYKENEPIEFESPFVIGIAQKI